MTVSVQADVCVVGAGFAGLAAARAARSVGAKVAVVEARDRVGGRTETVDVDSGLRIDIGGTWVAPDHDRFRALIDEAGGRLYPTPHRGDALLDLDGESYRYRGLVPKIGSTAIASLALGLYRLDRMARSVPPGTPWTSPRAAELDAVTVEEWIERHVHQRSARSMLHAFVRGMETCAPSEVSMLGMLAALSTTSGTRHTATVEGGAQQDLIAGGTGVVSTHLAAELGDDLYLSSAVRRISQSSAGVTVEAEGVTVAAASVVVSVPLPIIGRIDFDPPLPEDLRALADSLPVGCVVKSVVVYDEPFWRADGLSGETTSTSGPVELTLETTPPDGPAVLMAFAFGPTGRTHGALPPEQRRNVVLGELAKRFGPRALEPVAFVDKDWATDEWSAGCFAAHFPPGVLTSHGPALRTPVGRIFWAGVEFATEHYGYIEGAIRSGERAAQSALAVLSDPR